MDERSTGRKWLAGAGLVLAGAVLAWIVMAWLVPGFGLGRWIGGGSAQELVPRPRHIEARLMDGSRVVLPQAAQRLATSASPAPVAAAPPRSCGFEPLLPASHEGDGRFDLQAALDSRSTPDAQAYMAVAREAAADNRVRDTEVALIVACRVASMQSETASVPLASIQSDLGELYARMAAPPPADGTPGPAYARAHKLLADSVANFEAVLGNAASRTRMAAQRLASLEQWERAARAAAQEDAAAADAGAPADALATGAGRDAGDAQAHRAGAERERRRQAAQAEAEDTARMGAAPPSTRTQQREAVSARCAGRRGAADQWVCDDGELAQRERDLRRLASQAAAVTRDPEGFQRRMAQARAERDACTDRACVERWYARRKQQLFAEF